MTEQVEQRLDPGLWMGFMRSGPTNDGPWEFVDTERCEDPGTAARIIVSRQWTDGSHDVLVVGVESAHEFRITIATEDPHDH